MSKKIKYSFSSEEELRELINYFKINEVKINKSMKKFLKNLNRLINGHADLLTFNDKLNSVRICAYREYNNDDGDYEIIMYVDNNGLISKYVYDRDASIFATVDNNIGCTSFNNYDTDESICTTIRVTHNSDEYVTKYDYNDNKIYYKYCSDYYTREKTYSYNTDNKRIACDIKENERFDDRTIYVTETHKEYNDHGQLLHLISYENNSFDHEYIYEYNENHDITREYKSWASNTSEKLYTYVYNELGNIISEIKTTDKGCKTECQYSYVNDKLVGRYIKKTNKHGIIKEKWQIPYTEYRIAQLLFSHVSNGSIKWFSVHEKHSTGYEVFYDNKQRKVTEIKKGVHKHFVYKNTNEWFLHKLKEFGIDSILLK